MIPARFAPIVFAFLLSAQMSFLISGISTFRISGLTEGFFGLWIASWIPSWLVAFPCVLVVAPITRKLVSLFVK